jgi:hypothetical protein
MPFHVHLSVVEALKVFAYVLIIGTFWRLAQIKLRDTAVGQAMALAY